jgi:hypothetical protein
VLLALLAVTVLDDARSEVLTIYEAYHVLPEDSPEVVRFLYTDGSHVLLALAFLLWLFGRQRALRACQLALLGLVTFFLAVDVTMLIGTLGTRANETGAFALLWDAFLVWTANVLIFATWYWTVDRWGPGAPASDPRRPAISGSPSRIAPSWGASTGGQGSSTICFWHSTPAPRSA